MQTFKWKLFIFLLAAATVYAACRKTDRVAKAPPAADNTNRFFAAHASTHPLVQSVTRFMQAKNEQYGFVPQVIKQIGYPQWDKSMLVSMQGKSTSGRGNETGDSATIIYVPFVRDSKNFVNASLLVKLTPTDTAFQYLQDWQYASYGFDTTGDNGNARNVFHLFANFDREVFGRTAFKITDERLFGEPAAGEFVIAKLRPQQNNQQRQSILISVTMCDYIDVCYNPPGGNPCGNLECTVDCPQYEYTYTECTTIWVDDGWTPTGGGSGGGGGTGGGGGGTGWIPPPCPGGTARTELYENCTPGWVPTGGGGGTPPNTDPIDSMLKKISEFANKYSDSLFNISLNQRAEYSFTIVDYNNDIMDTLHVHTDGAGIGVNPNYGVYGGRRLRGIWHSHIVEAPLAITDTSALSGPSGDDVGNLFDLLNYNPPVPVLTECGFVRYALVVTNPLKASAFFKITGNGPLLLYNKLMLMIYNDPRSSTDQFHQVSIEKLLLILGNSSSSGIGLFKSNNPEKTTYTKLN